MGGGTGGVSDSLDYMMQREQRHIITCTDT